LNAILIIGFVVNKKLEDGRICSVPDSENSIPVAELQKIKEFVYEAFPDLVFFFFFFFLFSLLIKSLTHTTK